MPTAAATTDDPPPRRYITDKEWKKVKESLAKVGVNADTVEVELFAPDLKWPLRDALPLTFERADINGPKGASPRDAAKNQTDTIKRCNDLIAWLDNSLNYNRQVQRAVIEYKMRFEQPTGFVAEPRIRDMRAGCYESDQFLELSSLARIAQRHLRALVEELERCRDELMTVGTSRGDHLRKTHIEFWKELTRVWHDNVSKDVKFQNQHLINFLRACSEPFFPEEVITDGAISAFVERKSTSSK